MSANKNGKEGWVNNPKNRFELLAKTAGILAGLAITGLSLTACSPFTESNSVPTITKAKETVKALTVEEMKEKEQQNDYEARIQELKSKAEAVRQLSDNLKRQVTEAKVDIDDILAEILGNDFVVYEGQKLEQSEGASVMLHLNGIEVASTESPSLFNRFILP